MIDESVVDPDAAGDPRLRRSLLDVLARAFRDNPMNVAIHGPRPAHRLRANRAGLRGLVLDSAGLTETRVALRGGRVVAGLIAVPPGGYPLPAPRLRRQIGCWLGQGARAVDRWSRVTEELRLIHPDFPHWYLAVLGVHPDYQGRGLGSRLLDALVARAAEDGAQPIYLESDREASVRFYRTRGFGIQRELRIEGVRCRCLLRESAGAGRDLCDPVREP
jgi:GNAT superfamily N-acetyltransferase